MVTTTVQHVLQPDRPLRPVPRSQVRPDHAGGLLQPAGRLRRPRPGRSRVRRRSGGGPPSPPTDRSFATARTDAVSRFGHRDGGELAAWPSEARCIAASRSCPNRAWSTAARSSQGSGAFRGTGADGGRPRVIHVLERGDVRRPAELVGPGTPPIIKGVPWRFELPAGSPRKRTARRARPLDHRPSQSAHLAIDRQSRLAVSLWPRHRRRPATSAGWGSCRRIRSCSTGWRPSSATAANRSSGLHRLIVTSAAYRQVVDVDRRGEPVDAGNALLWRMNRRRLDAEAIRDSVLAASGRLDGRMYGPSFHVFDREARALAALRVRQIRPR